MKTYLKVLFNSEGARPADVVESLQGIGFAPTTGAHDFVYDWGETQSVTSILDFGNHIHAALKGTGALYEMETV